MTKIRTKASAAAAVVDDVEKQQEPSSSSDDVVDQKKVHSILPRMRMWSGQKSIWLRLMLLVLVICQLTGGFMLLSGEFMLDTSHHRALKAHSQYLVDCHGIPVTNNATTHQFVETKTASPFDMSVYPLDVDVVISKRIMDNGCWECHIVKLVTDAMAKYPKAYLVDIGGNIGMFANSVAAMGRKVFVFEPLEKSYSHICRTVEKNGFHYQLNLFRVAATRTPTKVQIHNFGKKNMGGTATHVIGGEKQPEGQEGVDFAMGIPIDSVRDVFPENRPVILKIDVEGNEIEALMGAQEFLQAANIVLAVMELRPPALGKADTETIFQMLREQGLKPMLNNEGTLIPMEGNPNGWEKQFSLGRLFDMAWVCS